MKKTIFDDSMKTFTHACDCYKKTNPMLMRKSFRMEDSYYRKNSPDDEILKLEFGMDSENYVLVVAGIVLGVLLVCKTVSCFRRSAEKRRMKKRYCKQR